MEKKEYYKHILPHFQQPGQAYFVTWVLKDAIHPHALNRYTEKLTLLKTQIEAIIGPAPGAAVSNRLKNNGFNPYHPESRLQTATPENDTKSPELIKLLNEYHSVRKKYIQAYDNLLAVTKSGTVDLMKPELTAVIVDAIRFWEGKRLETQAFCIMPNHVHWVFKVNETDENGKPVDLQVIMHSVKRQTANSKNKLTGKSGALWQKESFDTTIRDFKHEYNAIRYTLNNPVVAGFVNEWKEWPGNWCSDGCGGL